MRGSQYPVRTNFRPRLDGSNSPGRVVIVRTHEWVVVIAKLSRWRWARCGALRRISRGSNAREVTGPQLVNTVLVVGLPQLVRITGNAVGVDLKIPVGSVFVEAPPRETRR